MSDRIVCLDDASERYRYGHVLESHQYWRMMQGNYKVADLDVNIILIPLVNLKNKKDKIFQWL